jgi:hypothetical protein
MPEREAGMPEQLTKHPEVTLQVLRSAGAQCDAGVAPKILVKCPPARFCKLPGGEICIYGLQDAPQMTQLTRSDWRALQVQQKEDVPALYTVPWGTFLLGLAAAALAGAFAAAAWIEARRRRRLRRAPPR